jgi:hypothetical protein
MANNNVQNVRFLRNGTLFTSREQATSALTNFTLTSEMDGSSILARYQEGTDPIKTLVGYVYYQDASNKSITIFDIDDAGADVDEKIKTAIEALDAEITSTDGKNLQVKVTEVDGKITAVNVTTDNTVNSGDVANAITEAISDLDVTDTAVNGQYVSQVSEADGKIAVTRVALPSVNAISEDGKPITAVSESLGAISATAGTINAEFVNIADSGSLITATTVEGALAEIASEIDAMDLAVVSGDGEVITAVSETDGKVSASKTAIKDVKLTGYVNNTTATGAISATDDIEDALSKLENTISSNEITNADGSITVTPANGSTTDVKVHIKEGEKVVKLDANQGGIYTDIKIASATPSSTTVKEEYNLLDSDGNALGASIKIYKDSHIVSITYITDSGDTHYQNLEYKYIDADGVEQVEYVDISSLVLEAEFASGVTATDHVVHGVVDPTSETFLTVGGDGFKLAGVQSAINSAINALDATVGSTTIATGKHVAVEVAEADGVLTALTVTEDDIASAQGLADEITARGNADTELSNRLGTSVTTANTASAQLSALSGTSADASGVTSVYGAKAYAKDYTDEKVAAVVDGLDADVSGNSTHVTVGVQEESGVITAVTVSESNIANANDLTAEIAARKAVDGQNGDTYAANTNANYISGATSLNDADVKLDAALKVADDAMLTEVTAGNGIDVATKANKSQTISAKVKIDGGIVNDEDGLHLGYIDCGTY